MPAANQRVAAGRGLPQVKCDVGACRYRGPGADGATVVVELKVGRSRRRRSSRAWTPRGAG